MYQLFNLEFSNALQNITRRKNKPNGMQYSKASNCPGPKSPG
jgi:hypothetical protein